MIFREKPELQFPKPTSTFLGIKKRIIVPPEFSKLGGCLKRIHNKAGLPPEKLAVDEMLHTQYTEYHLLEIDLQGELFRIANQFYEKDEILALKHETNLLGYVDPTPGELLMVNKYAKLKGFTVTMGDIRHTPTRRYAYVLSRNFMAGDLNLYSSLTRHRSSNLKVLVRVENVVQPKPTSLFMRFKRKRIQLVEGTPQGVHGAYA